MEWTNNGWGQAQPLGEAQGTTSTDMSQGEAAGAQGPCLVPACGKSRNQESIPGKLSFKAGRARIIR